MNSSILRERMVRFTCAFTEYGSQTQGNACAKSEGMQGAHTNVRQRTSVSIIYAVVHRLDLRSFSSKICQQTPNIKDKHYCLIRFSVPNYKYTYTQHKNTQKYKQILADLKGKMVLTTYGFQQTGHSCELMKHLCYSQTGNRRWQITEITGKCIVWGS